jgi:hypothetical protein
MRDVKLDFCICDQDCKHIPETRMSCMDKKKLEVMEIKATGKNDLYYCNRKFFTHKNNIIARIQDQ